MNISFLTVKVVSATSAEWCFPVATYWLLLPTGHRQQVDCADLVCTLVYRVGSIPSSISGGIGGCDTAAWVEELEVEGGIAWKFCNSGSIPLLVEIAWKSCDSGSIPLPVFLTSAYLSQRSTRCPELDFSSLYLLAPGDQFMV